MRTFLASLLLIALTGAGHPSSAADLRHCIPDAAARFHVTELAMHLILDVEAGWVGARIPNSNGTHDLGPWQINTIHLPELAQLGIDEHALVYDACISTYVAAFLLARHLRASGDLVEAIGRYHSRTPRHKARYLRLVRDALDRRLAAIASVEALPDGS